MNDLMTLGMHRGWKRKTAALASQNLAGTALDVSTGTGDLAFQLAKHTRVNRTVALDLLPEMIGRAQKRANCRPGCEVNLLPRNMPDVRKAISEMTRVIRPGGRVTLLELSPMESGMRAQLFRMYFHRLVPLVGSIVARDRDAYTYLPRSVDVFYGADELMEILREAGLHSVGYSRLGFGTVCLHWGDKPLN
ncbi:Ubiquinone/menaquinone biosynthesis C-methyltransferase UbiE [Geodia barretti]|uniref:Ubiquinone/menaquinone biosynthesis C-methyltransferase UbiE n=1 Tax=Geodia barretti TaxID=519541 RepID=A0AA35XH44_GEOBA|nr:Ubiquinone/menaquinone biosynthesis C-methyltransferase UbiE [Geodia barretti]